MKKIAFISLLCSSVLMAGGYRIPEVSTNATALSSAVVAHSIGADASYYNPANMSFTDDINQMEIDLTYIGLSAVNYKGSVTNALGTTSNVNTSSEKESFLVPTLFYVSPKFGDIRYGISLVSPGGLTKRWKDQPAASLSEEFSLQTIEINPSVSYMVKDNFSIAAGLRMVYSSGIVKAQIPTVYSQNLEGDSTDFGYNLALAYKPTKEMEFAMTYRSKVDITVEGDADLFNVLYINPLKNVGASVTIPLPAVLNVAYAYTFSSKTTIEFVYEKSYWSAYKDLDFDFNDITAESVFGAAKYKNWKDTNAYRLGVTHKIDKTTLMAGIVLDENPIPDETVGFELPDSDSTSVSLGARYLVNSKLDIGLSGLYSIREDRKVNNSILSGEFTDTKVLLVSIGAGYKF